MDRWSRPADRDSAPCLTGTAPLTTRLTCVRPSETGLPFALCPRFAFASRPLLSPQVSLLDHTVLHSSVAPTAVPCSLCLEKIASRASREKRSPLDMKSSRPVIQRSRRHTRRFRVQPALTNLAQPHIRSRVTKVAGPGPIVCTLCLRPSYLRKTAFARPSERS